MLAGLKGDRAEPEPSEAGEERPVLKRTGAARPPRGSKRRGRSAPGSAPFRLPNRDFSGGAGHSGSARARPRRNAIADKRRPIEVRQRVARLRRAGSGVNFGSGNKTFQGVAARFRFARSPGSRPGRAVPARNASRSANKAASGSAASPLQAWRPKGVGFDAVPAPELPFQRVTAAPVPPVTANRVGGGRKSGAGIPATLRVEAPSRAALREGRRPMFPRIARRPSGSGRD